MMHSWVVACHEAGHAVACTLLGLDIRYVTIEPDRKALGHVHPLSELKTATAEERRAWTQVYLAGWVGEELLTGLVHEATPSPPVLTLVDGGLSESSRGSSAPYEGPSVEESDSGMVAKLAFMDTTELAQAPDKLLHGRSLIHAARQSVKKLLSDNMSSLEAVASALYARKRLTGDEVCQLVNVDLREKKVCRMTRDLYRGFPGVAEGRYGRGEAVTGATPHSGAHNVPTRLSPLKEVCRREMVRALHSPHVGHLFEELAPRGRGTPIGRVGL